MIRERETERHAGEGEDAVMHTTATIAGRLRAERDVGDMLRAVFPAGSITGAPKIRAMQIIDALERRPRAAYCGAIGYVSDCGNACFNVAIRTATLTGRPLEAARPYGRIKGQAAFPVGAGIVADSDPSLEWQETLQKGAAFIRAAADYECDRTGDSP